jgi:hypothetical protein
METSSPSPSPTPIPPPRPPTIASSAGFVTAVHWFCEAAIARGARTMWWLDPDFRDWPLDDAALLDTLAAWLRLPGRHLVLVAADWSRATREHPRFSRWRLPWSHAVDTRRVQDEDAGAVPTLLLDDGPLSVQVLEREYWRGRCSRDAVDAHALRERFDALTQRSEPDFPPTTLGL